MFWETLRHVGLIATIGRMLLVGSLMHGLILLGRNDM